jgi:predicted GNAT family acetyltransferase
MEPMRTRRFDSIPAFLDVAGPYLAAREAEHNLILGVLSSVQRDPAAFEPPLLATVESDCGAVLGAVLRTPPHNLIMSEFTDRQAVGTLVRELSAEPLPGLVGPPDAVREFSEAWVETHGGSWRIVRRERIYQLTAVTTPPPGEGAPRLANASDRGLLADWLPAFELEALDEVVERGLLERGLDSWGRGSGKRFWLWEVDGRAVSLVGAGGRTPNGMRIGPVYTPPQERGRGYASRLTAFVSETLLAEGHRFCFLYTDVDNPTANHIYQEIGYRPVTDALMVSFGA